MLKKLFVTAAAAAAVSVPLAGVAWAAPSSNAGSNPNPVGQGGIPTKLGGFLTSVGAPNAAPTVTPGAEFHRAKIVFPGVSPTPAVIGDFLNDSFTVLGIPNTAFGPTAPGLVTKTLTPACSSGHGATDPAVNNGGPICIK